MHSLNIILSYILVLLFLRTNAKSFAEPYFQLIDDFTTPYFNNIGGIRSGLIAYDSLTYPRNGLVIPNKEDYLLESFSKEHSDVRNKCLQIHYTGPSPSTTLTTFMFLQRNPNPTNTFQVTSTISTSLLSSQKEKYRLPFSIFHGADLANAYGFGIHGPITVHRLELIHCRLDTLSFDFVRPKFAIQKLSPTFPLFRTRSNSEQVVSEISHNLDKVWSLNSLGLRRSVSRGTKVSNGIKIGHVGYLYENIVAQGKVIDLSGKYIQIRYSSDQPSTIRIKLQYHIEMGEPANTECSFVTPHLKLQAGVDRIKNIVLNGYQAIQFRKCRGIWILGSLTVHRIDIVTSSIWNSFGLQPRNVLLVDNFSSTYSNHENTGADSPNDFQTSKSSRENLSIQPGFGLNNLGRLSGGKGVIPRFIGIDLLPKGYVYQRLSSQNDALDLTGAFIRLNHLPSKPVTCKLECVTVIPGDSKTDYYKHKVQITFKLKKKVTRVSVGQCGLTQAIYITSSARLRLDSIFLSFPSTVNPNWIEKVLIDNFLDWAYTNSHLGLDGNSRTTNTEELDFPEHDLVSNNNGNDCPGRHTYFDYRNEDLNHAPILHKGFFVHGQGINIKIMESGYLLHPLHCISGSSIEIQYSSDFAGILRIVLFIKYEVNESIGRIDEDYVNVSIQYGKNNRMDVLAPYHDVKPVSVIGICIDGPLVVHHIRIVKNVNTIATVPINCAPDRNRLLIDDFSDWENMNANVLNRSRQVSGIPSPGSITLNHSNDYLVEYFVGSLGSQHLKHLAFHVVYTTQNDAICHISLLSNRFNSPKQMVISDEDITKEVTFKAGTKLHQMIPILSTFFSTDFLYHGQPFFGVRINGPSLQKLTMHRIELVINAAMVQRDLESSNAMVEQYTQLVLLSKLPSVQRKLAWNQANGIYKFRVHRDNIWKDAFSQFGISGRSRICRQLKTIFVGEKGKDGGGLTREFFSLLSSEIANPDHKLFVSTAESNYDLRINEDSVTIPKSRVQVFRCAVHDYGYLQYFRFVGRIIGMAIRTGSTLGISFVPHIYKLILDNPTGAETAKDNILPKLIENADFEVDISDVQAVDSVLYTQLRWYLDNDITNLVEQTMTMCFDQAGITHTVELFENGAEILVTESNKKQYVQEYANWNVHKLVQDQANELRKGIYEVLPEHSLSRLSVSELRLLLGGVREIDVDDWGKHSKFNNVDSTAPIVSLFWQCVWSWDSKKRSDLLQFVTGSPRVPGIGFSGLNPIFTINILPNSKRLPEARTCENQLNLPNYPTFEMLAENLETAIQSGQGLFDLE